MRTRLLLRLTGSLYHNFDFSARNSLRVVRRSRGASISRAMPCSRRGTSQEHDQEEKSPAQGGPTRGSSALGLGGKIKRAEQHKPGGRGFVPPSRNFLRRPEGILEHANFVEKAAALTS
jgi:hypothetical protein